MLKHRIPETRKEWLQQRMRGIGGSDAGAVSGISKWKSPYTLWCEKTGKIPSSAPDNYYMRDGRLLEDVVARIYMEESGQKVTKSNFSYQSEEYPWMLANIDRWIKPGKVGLEIKTMDVRKQIDIEDGDIPPEYYTQCVHYMAVTGAIKWVIAVWRFGQPLVIHEIERDEKEIQALIQMEKEFWEMVENETPPEITGSDSDKKTLDFLYAQSNPDIDIQLIGMDADLELRKALKEKSDELDKEIKEIENRIRLEMKDAEKAHTDGFSCKWKTIHTNSFDQKKFKEENPDSYKNYLKSGSYKRLTITERKNA